MSDCIFCEIIKKDVSSNILYENEKLIVFEDIKPDAPLHYLIVPKEHIGSINDLRNGEMIGEMFLTAKKIADKLGIKDSGYRLVINVGKGGGQIVKHLHLHILGGW